MEPKVLLFLGIIAIVIFLWTITNTYAFEGFTSLEDQVQDRSNPLASQQNPLNNPAARIGISEAQADTIRKVSEAALNIPTAVPTGTGSFTYTDPSIKNSPRIDTEASFLGLVKFCKERGAQPNPFSDPKFVKDCGMCLTSGSLITGEAFEKPTGVLVYDKDKEKAMNVAKMNGSVFPRVIPSLNAGVCKGASTSEDALPVLAIDEKSYNAFQKRLACRHGGIVGNGCGICQSNKEFSWIDPNGGFQPLALSLAGEGVATVRVAGRQIGNPFSLRTNLTKLELGEVPEGAQIQVEVIKGETVKGPLVFGRMESTNPNGRTYRINLQMLIEKDAVTGSTPRRTALGQMTARPGGDRLVLEGRIPLTFVDPDQLAAYDCKASPYMTQQASAELLIDDPCLKPSGQKPGSYSKECLKSKVLEGGCTSDGSWYKDPPAGQMTLGNFLSWIRERAGKVDTDPAIARACTGADITTPCDKFLNNTEMPDKKCLTYLYSNASEKNKRVGNTYKYASQSFTSLNGKNVQFCQPTGALNPETSQGEAELMGVARGYRGNRGIEAVRRYLSDIFDKAIGSLDINKRDVEGGKRDSWAKCFGVPIADPVVSKVKLNERGTVVGKEADLVCDRRFPSNFIPRANTIAADGFQMPRNYVLSFTVIPRGTRGGWGNLFRFGVNTGNGGVHGQRALAVWFWPGDTRLHVIISHSGDWNWGLNPDRIPLDQESKFRLECNETNVTLTVNSQTFSVFQTNRFTGPVTFSISDRFHEAANCEIKNFCFTPL